MKPTRIFSFLTIAGAFFVLAGTRSVLADENWPQFRGPLGDGHAIAKNLPLSWSESKNIIWKTPIHDFGWSSPVVWGKQVWLTTATADGRALYAMGLDRVSGKILHDIKVFEVDKPETINPSNSYASPTSLIEEGRLYVHFGTYGTACIDTKTGIKLWERRDINCTHEVGPGSSLTSAGNALIMIMDGNDQQYVIALDKGTGKNIWKTQRSIDYSKYRIDMRKSFSTATLTEAAGRSQLICTGAMCTMGYDAKTGEEIWKTRANGWSTAVRPVCGFGMAFVGPDCVSPKLWAIRLDGRGDVTDTHVVWKLEERMPATASPLLVNDLLYVISDSGFLSCIEAKTGKIVWEQMIGGSFGSSPFLANGRIYLFSKSGKTTVIAPGRKYQALAVNQLDGAFMACPAVVNNCLFVRSKTDMYCIGLSGK